MASRLAQESGPGGPWRRSCGWSKVFSTAGALAATTCRAESNLSIPVSCVPAQGPGGRAFPLPFCPLPARRAPGRRARTGSNLREGRGAGSDAGARTRTPTASSCPWPAGKCHPSQGAAPQVQAGKLTSDPPPRSLPLESCTAALHAPAWGTTSALTPAAAAAAWAPAASPPPWEVPLQRPPKHRLLALTASAACTNQWRPPQDQGIQRRCTRRPAGGRPHSQGGRPRRRLRTRASTKCTCAPGSRGPPPLR
jgi:hypothetical protein